MAGYHDFEAFFHGMVNVQIKGGVLQATAANAAGHHDRAERAAAALNATLTSHARRFLTAVERLVAAYSPDYSLFHTIRNPDTDPVRQAHSFIQCIPGAKGSRVWIWNGSGPTFQTMKDPPAPDTLRLSAGGVQVSADSEWREDTARPLGVNGNS